MEAPLLQPNKVPAKSPTPKVMGLADSASLAAGQPMVIRAKVSSGLVRARSHTGTGPSVSTNGTPKVRNTSVRSALTPDAVRSSSPTKFTVRSPSPSKFMRPSSPVKHVQPVKSIGRPPASMSKVASRPVRVDKSSTSVITVFDDSHSATSSSPSLLLQSKGDSSDTVYRASTNSLRVKAKVATSLPKLASQTIPTIVSPPSPPSTSSSIPSPIIIPSRTRVRAMTTTRRPSVHSPPTVDESLLIPLPTSPPTSTLSFSSRSSTSISSIPSYSTHEADTPATLRLNFPSKDHLGTSTSFAFDEKTPDELKQSKPLIARVRADTRISGVKDQTSRHSLSFEHGTSMEGNVSLSDEGEAQTHKRKNLTSRSFSLEQEEEERAEAKSNRKIADLEITNKSLLAINASLEADKARQAGEIRGLRRKLRQARLGLPPTSYKLLSEGDRKLGNEEDNESTDAEEEDKDECFQRVKHILDDLLNSGRKALDVSAPSFNTNSSKIMLTKHAESEVLTWNSQKTSAEDNPQREWKHGVAIGHRVLSAEEAKKWNDDTNIYLDDTQGADIDISQTNTLEEEEEVEREVGIDCSNQDTFSTEDNPEDISTNFDIPP